MPKPTLSTSKASAADAPSHTVRNAAVPRHPRVEEDERREGEQERERDARQLARGRDDGLEGAEIGPAERDLDDDREPDRDEHEGSGEQHEQHVEELRPARRSLLQAPDDVEAPEWRPWRRSPPR